MTVASAKAKLDAQGGDPATGYISKQDVKDSYDELMASPSFTGTVTSAGAVVVDSTTDSTSGTTGSIQTDGGIGAAKAIVAGTTVSATGLAGGLLSSASPVMDSVAAAGTSAIPSRQDHVHPSDTTKVTGPASATDNAVARFDATTGKLVQNSGVIIDDSNNVTGLGTVASGAVTSSGAVQAAAASGFVVGSSGPKILSGTGSPEGVVTAPVGSQWLQSDSTVGAFRWRKASGTGNTGWVVADGDTGQRNIASLANTSGVPTMTVSTATLCRTGNMVSLFLVWNDTQTTPFRVQMFTAASGAIPSGFRALGGYFRVPYDAATDGNTRNVYVQNDGGIQYGGQTTSNNFVANLTWRTNDSWPSSLPGSAA